MSNYIYYKLHLKLLTEMLGTCTEASIYNQHILKKSQKMIEEAHRLANKAKKAYEKYKGTELPPEKEVQELQAVVRRYQEVIGKKEEVPGDADALFDYIEKIKLEFEEKVSQGEESRATCFMRDPKGHVCISTHMILGNLKEIARTLVNNGDKSVIKSKVSLNEVMAVDIKPVERFIRPNMDIERHQDGRPKLFERPIRFERMGKQEVSIVLSEVLPAEAEFTVHLRVRKETPVNEDFLRKLFDMGKNIGLGQWRGSGGYGAYKFHLEQVDYKENFNPEGNTGYWS